MRSIEIRRPHLVFLGSLLFTSAAALAVCGALDHPDDLEAPPTVEEPELASEPSSTVTKVVVFSDRARVTRQAAVTFDAGPTVFEFKRLPAWVDDGSVRVSASPGRVVDVSVERTFLARSTDPAFVTAESALRRLTDEAAALDDELAVVASEMKQVESIQAFSSAKLTQEMTGGGGDIDDYRAVVDFVGGALRRQSAAKRRVARRRSELGPEITAAQRHLDELKTLTSLEQTVVRVVIEGPVGEQASVELTYQLPGATWEPSHELRTDPSNPSRVKIVSFASITQTSGEDWSNAEITFSTQSATDAVRIPELSALTVGHGAEVTTRTTRSTTSFSRAQHAYVAQNEGWNRYNHRKELSRFEKVYKDNVQRLEVVQHNAVQIFQQLRARGTTQPFKAEGRATVRSDGHPVRLRVGRTELSGQQQIVAVPEESMNAAVTLAAVNGAQPLLPGKVALYDGGAFVGMTEIEFVGAGEKFSTFLRVADHIKLSRVLDKRHSSLVRNRRTRMQLAFVVEVENLSSKETVVALADRIPVSQSRDIVIDRVVVEPSVAPDSQGLLRWNVTLGPKEKRTFRVGYRLEYPPTLLLQTAPGGKTHRRLRDHIQDMETNAF